MPVTFPISLATSPNAYACFSTWPAGVNTTTSVGSVTGLSSGTIWTASVGVGNSITFTLSSTPSTQTFSFFYKQGTTTSNFQIGETIQISGVNSGSGTNINGNYYLYNKFIQGESLYHHIICLNSIQPPSNNTIYNYSNQPTSNSIFGKSWIYSTANNTWNSLSVPIGTIMPYAGLNAPNGWLFCDGSSISTTTYEALYKILTLTINASTTSGSNYLNVSSVDNVGVGMAMTGPNINSNSKIFNVNAANVTQGIGLTYAATATGSGTYVVWPFGVGASANTFKLPDLRSRLPIGSYGNGMGNVYSIQDRVFGISGGSETVALTDYTMPIHSHTITETAHFHSGNTDNETQNHYHPSYMQRTYDTEPDGKFYGLGLVLGSGGGFYGRIIVNGNDYDYPSSPQPPVYPGSGSPISDNHKHGCASMNSQSINTDSSTSSTGGSQAHDNIQPYLPANYIIKY